MILKRILLIVPLAIVLLLLQSYFWVPKFDEQFMGSSKRLTQFIQGSIGDAQILNPILHSDSSSGAITDKIFDGLIDRDRDLSYRGRLAKSWKIIEEAFFVPNTKDRSAEDVARKLQNAKNNSSIPWLDNISKIEVVPPKISKTSNESSRGKTWTKVHYPKRIKLTLRAVDQDLFDKIKTTFSQKLIEDDFSSFSTKENKKKIKLTEHNPIIIFELRGDVKFHDGHEFDAKDVLFTYQSIMNDKNLSPRKSDFEPIKSMEILEENKIKIIYKRLYSPAFGTWAIGILPEHLLNEKTLKREAKERKLDRKNFTLRLSNFNRNPIGTGPFKFKEWRSDELIKLKKNEQYWDGPPNYSEFIYRIIPDSLTQEMAFYTGTIDSYGAGVHQVNRLKKDRRFQVFSGLSFGYTYIGYNMRRKPFNDVRVRRALGMAINTEQIHRYILNNQAENITGPFIKQGPHYNKVIKPIAFDPKKAIKLLNEAGWEKRNGILVKNGKRLRFKLLTNHGNEIRKSIATVVQDSWKRIGIVVSFDTVEWAVFIKKHINELNFDAVILGWSLGLDPDLYQIWHSSQTNKGQLNFVGYKNRTADQLIVKIRQEYDLKKQILYAHKLHRIIATDQPYTFLYNSKWTALLDRKIAILQKPENGTHIAKKITATKTGSYSFDFNKWIKFPTAPIFESKF
ncbi:MAG: ABC transporter substrate-binding protein [Nitrospinota bacterium]|nr:ABC transporter substrate-binding protein [Nitrospinota bacterium]